MLPADAAQTREDLALSLDRPDQGVSRVSQVGDNTVVQLSYFIRGALRTKATVAGVILQQQWKLCEAQAQTMPTYKRQMKLLLMTFLQLVYTIDVINSIDNRVRCDEIMQPLNESEDESTVRSIVTI